MANFSRFQNLEHQRPVRGEAAPVPLKRFGEDTGAPRAPATAPAPNPVAQRFGTDASSEVRLAQDDLSRLPSLECGACGTENGKFDVACRSCGSRMDTEATRVRNVSRLQTLAAQHSLDREQLARRRDAEVEQLAALKAGQRRDAEHLAQDIAGQYRKPLGTSRPLKVSTIALVALILVVVVSHSLPVSLLASVGALALLAAKLGLLGKLDHLDWF